MADVPDKGRAKVKIDRRTGLPGMTKLLGANALSEKCPGALPLTGYAYGTADRKHEPSNLARRSHRNFCVSVLLSGIGRRRDARKKPAGHHTRWNDTWRLCGDRSYCRFVYVSFVAR